LNERGKEGFSETAIDYDSTYEKVELEYARTIKPDGAVVEVGSRHIRDVSKYLNFPLYSNARVFIISFPEIVEGAAIEYKVKIYRNQLINKKDFVLNYPVQSSEPILSARFVARLPKAMPLQIKLLNEQYNTFGATLMPQKVEDGNYRVYTWDFKDIPQIVPESNMPADVEINPTILLSTFTRWEDVHQWWWELARDKIQRGKVIQDKAKELTQGLSSEEEKVRAIYNFCAQKIRYVAVEYGQAGYEPHQAEDILKNKYGDCKDQAVLLVALLKEAGIPAGLTLIATDGYYNLHDDFPTVLFNHCIAVAFLQDSMVFLDPTAETCSFGDLPGPDQGRRVLVFKPDGFSLESTPFYPAEHNLLKQLVTMKVNLDETIRAERSVIARGQYEQAQRYWLLYTPPEIVAERLKEKIQEISIGATLTKYNIENLNNLNKPVMLSYVFQGPEYFSQAGTLRIMPQLSGVDTSLVAKDTRRYPIDLKILDLSQTVFEIGIPENFVIKYMPTPVREENPWFGFSAEYLKKENAIYFSQSLTIKKAKISEGEYPEFKKLYESLAKKIKQRVILEKISDAAQR
jgi:hypothetical protein